MTILLYVVMVYIGIGTIFSMVMALSYEYSNKTKNSFNEYMDRNSLNRDLIPIFIIATILFWGLGILKIFQRKKDI